MTNEGSPEELEHRRFLAVQRLSEGYTTEEVADFLDVEPRSVRRWFAAFRQHGQVALRAQGAPGRPSKWTFTQQKSSCAGWRKTRPSSASPPNSGPLLAWPNSSSRNGMCPSTSAIWPL